MDGNQLLWLYGIYTFKPDLLKYLLLLAIEPFIYTCVSNYFRPKPEQSFDYFDKIGLYLLNKFRFRCLLLPLCKE